MWIYSSMQEGSLTLEDVINVLNGIQEENIINSYLTQGHILDQRIHVTNHGSGFGRNTLCGMSPPIPSPFLANLRAHE